MISPTVIRDETGHAPRFRVQFPGRPPVMVVAANEKEAVATAAVIAGVPLPPAPEQS